MWLSRSVSALFVSLAVLAGQSGAQSAPDADEKDVRAKLAGEAKHLSARSYVQAKPPSIEVLKRNKSVSFTLQLNAGTTYAIIAACDTDCGHVAVALLDAKGQLLVESPEKHHTVIVNGPAAETARHTARVTAPGCREDECYVGLLLLQEQLKSSAPPTMPSVAASVYRLPPEIFTPYDNYDLIGGDLRRLQDTDMAGCASACEADRSCAAYSFDKWNRWCFLKDAAVTFRLEPNTMSGIRTSVAKPPISTIPVAMLRYRGKAFPWEGQETRGANSFEECEGRCQTLESCVAWTFFREKKQCRLMATTGEYFRDPRADSGIKRQEPSR